VGNNTNAFNNALGDNRRLRATTQGKPRQAAAARVLKLSQTKQIGILNKYF